jgi:hypothetical protein
LDLHTPLRSFPQFRFGYASSRNLLWLPFLKWACFTIQGLYSYLPKPPCAACFNEGIVNNIEL